MSTLTNIFIGFLPQNHALSYMSKPSPFEGIDMVIYIRLPEDKKKVHYVVKDSFGLRFFKEEELWKMAYQNTVGDAACMNFFGMNIISNEDKFLGASRVLNLDAVRACIESYGTTNLIVIPSSIHEMILVPHHENEDLDHITETIKNVNADEMSVRQNEILADKAFPLDLEKIKEIAAMFAE